MSDLQFKGGAKALLASLERTTVTVEGGGTVATVTLGDALKKLAHKPADYMPAIKKTLGLGDLATHAECAEHLERLRGRVEACLEDEEDPEGEHGGIDLGAYSKPLKSLVDASPGDTWEEVFDAVEALIQAAIEEHEVREHSGAAPMSDAGAGGSALATAAQTPAGTAPAPIAPAATSGEAPMSDEQIKKLTDQFDAKFAEVSCQMTALTGKVTEQAQVIAAKEAEIVSLRDAQIKRDKELATARVDEAFSTYKDKMLLTDAHKPQMALYLATAPDAFEKLYPKVEANQRHLLANLTGGAGGAAGTGGARQPGTEGGVLPPNAGGPVAVKPPSLRVLAVRLAEERKIELADAQRIVYAYAREHGWVETNRQGSGGAFQLTDQQRKALSSLVAAGAGATAH